ncbi:hypothetical protein [Sphingomonas sp. Y38-1Y]|uniref:hypothetical protein n=1 Tax=Sphingomonas sp. Y38-1Y TaxID=3078265 RepID=UPI0028EAFA2A|nr:hypothetical protein [Sphingomonas sp. Y38-1Y]
MLLTATILLAAAGLPQGQLVPKQRVVADYAACLVRNSERSSLRLMETLPGSAEEARVARDVSVGGFPCLKGRRGLSLQTGAVRGAIAEALFARDPAMLAVVRRVSAASPARPPMNIDGRAFVIAYADCLVASDPARSADLVSTEIGSATERSAFLGYGEALKRCMPERASYRANVTDIRNHVAAALYRVARSRTEAKNA